MKKTLVFFDFENDEQWLEFGKKFYDAKQFEQAWAPVVKYFMNKHKTFEHMYKNDIRPTWYIDENGIEQDGDPRPFIIALPCIYTRSKKVLTTLNKWIKENNYEHNYELAESDGVGIFFMEINLDELLFNKTI